MEDRNRSTYQHSGAVIGIPYNNPSSNISVGIPYPYAIQPQPRHVNRPAPNQTPPQLSPQCNKFCIICMVLSIIIVFLALFTILFVFGTDVVFDTRDPKVEVESMVVSPFNVSGGTTSPMVTAHWDIGFLITNPSKRMKIKYKLIVVAIYYKEEFLSGTVVKPFVPHGKNPTLLQVSSGVLDKQLDDGVSSSLAESMRDGSVEFNIHLISRVKNFSPGWMVVSCPYVRVGFSSNTTTAGGTMLGGSTRCEVTWKSEL